MISSVLFIQSERLIAVKNNRGKSRIDPKNKGRNKLQEKHFSVCVLIAK